jgi:hypothetical protein
MTSQPWPPKLPVRHGRIARPTDQLDEVARFYREGLGLPELGRFAGHAGYRGVLLGLPGMPYHLEFTQHDHGSPGLAPSRDNLLVLYFDDRAQWNRLPPGWLRSATCRWKRRIPTGPTTARLPSRTRTTGGSH